MSVLILRHGRDKSVRRRHPWIFSGAVARVEGTPGPGDSVQVRSAQGAALGVAAYSPASQIRARLWSVDPADSIDADFLRARIAAAVDRRARLPGLARSNAARLVHGESDHLPGLIVDRYDDVLVVQLLAAGVERWRDAIVDLLCEVTECTRVYERSDAGVRALEGLDPRSGWVRGDPGGEGTVRCPIIENGLQFRVDLAQGQKTGFFLDQRDNRSRVRALAQGRTVLDAFCYTGGFALATLAGGARHVTAIDSSEAALAVARENLAANALEPSGVEFVAGDVFTELRRLRDRDRRFDLVVLDPPKFAPTAAQAKNAARAYKDINLLAFKLLAPGGLLATFSCSGGVNAALFQSIVAGAALDAGVDARIVERFAAAPDHPVALTFPEGEYLKGLLLLRD